MRGVIVALSALLGLLLCVAFGQPAQIPTDVVSLASPPVLTNTVTICWDASPGIWTNISYMDVAFCGFFVGMSQPFGDVRHGDAFALALRSVGVA